MQGEGCTKPGPASHNSSNSHSLNALGFRLAAAQYRWKEFERKLSPLGEAVFHSIHRIYNILYGLLLACCSDQGLKTGKSGKDSAEPGSNVKHK